MNDPVVLTNAVQGEDSHDPGPRDAWIFPTSFAQRRLWFIDLADPGNPLYNVPNAFTVRGRLDHALLDRAFADVIARHEILRTAFHPVDGEPMQLVAAISDFRLASFDLRSLPTADREAGLDRIIREQSEAPFDLRNGPLLRAALLDLAPTEQILVICLHLSVTDCYSQELLMTEVMSAYSAMADGKAPSFPELPIQYADFAAWQRDVFRGEILEKELAFWREKLAGLEPIEFPDLPPHPGTPAPEIPENQISEEGNSGGPEGGRAKEEAESRGLQGVGEPRLASTTHPPSLTAGAPQALTFPFTLPEPLCATVRSMAQAEGVTPFMALLAGWNIFLNRYTGQTDIAVSSPVSGRSRTETEGLIGSFLNVLLLRTSLAGNPTVRETLHRLRDTALDAFTHQDLPFEIIADDFLPEPPPGKNPLLRAMFVLLTGEEKTWRTPNAVIEPLILAEPSPKFDLMLRLRDTGTVVTGVLVYDGALFTAETIQRIASQYESLLSGMAAHPEIGINAFHLISPGEQNSYPAQDPRSRNGHQSPDPQSGERQAPYRSNGEEEAAGRAGIDWPPQPQRESELPTAVHPVHPVHDTPPPALPVPAETPATWMEAALVETWQDILNRHPIAVTDDFFDLGGNSILAIRMLVEAEKRTGIHIAPRLVFEYPTIRRLAVEARHPESRTHSPVVAVQSGGSLTPVFFLHGDFVEGGLYCVKMARHLGQDRPFYAIDPHGVHDAPPHSIEEMASARIELIRQIRPKGPYILGGFCNGGLVAFEMARQLETAGESVSSLILLSADGSNAEFSWLERLIALLPGPGDRKFRSFLKWRERILFARAAWQRQLADLAEPIPISQRPRRFARKALRAIREALGLLLPRPSTAHGVDITSPEAAGIDIGLIYHQACKAYVPRPYRGPAHVLWPGEVPLRDPSAGWGSVMPQIKLIQVPGGHFTSLQGENLLILSENLRACLVADRA